MLWILLIRKGEQRKTHTHTQRQKTNQKTQIVTEEIVAESVLQVGLVRLSSPTLQHRSPAEAVAEAAGHSQAQALV